MNERLETNDTLTPKAIGIKIRRQLDFQRQDIQDHGSRGTLRYKGLLDNRKPKTHKPQTAEQDHIDEQLKVMSSAEIEAVANAILAAAEDKARKEADAAFHKLTDGSGILTSESDSFRKHGAIPEVTDEIDPAEEPLSYYDEEIVRLGYAGPDALRGEVKTAFSNSMKHQAYRDYEGASPEEGPDYVDGFSFRSRP